MVKPKGTIEEVEEEYQKYAKIFWGVLVIAMFFLLIFQSYLAQPRSLTILFFDTWELLLLFIPIIYMFLSGRKKALLIFGLFYLIIFLLMIFQIINFIEPIYGTLFFLGFIWFIGDWINIKIFNKSLSSELIKGNYYLALGIILSTMVIGGIIELANIPFRVWWYSWPFPSLEFFGLPIFTIIFGWLPWIMAMFVIFYPFATKQPKKFN